MTEMALSAVTRRAFSRTAMSGVALAVLPVRGILAQSAPTGAVALTDLNRMNQADFVAVLGETFERAPWVAELAYDKRPFATVKGMHDTMFEILKAAPREKQLVLLGVGVDVLAAGAAARTANITGESKREQANVGLDSMSDADAARFHQMGEAYKAKFGFPFIIAVLRYTRESIMTELERRLANDPATEFAAAIQEVYYISRLRVAARVTGDGMPQVNGLLDTHVLDATSGKPAEGMSIELFEFTFEQARRIGQTKTNGDGRNAAPLIAGRPLPIGRYELRFGVGDYFRTRAQGLDKPPFLDIVPLRFSVAAPETHYHVPLLCTPWSYSTYKGS